MRPDVDAHFHTKVFSTLCKPGKMRQTELSSLAWQPAALGFMGYSKPIVQTHHSSPQFAIFLLISLTFTHHKER